MEVPELQLANLRGGETREKPQEIKAVLLVPEHASPMTLDFSVTDAMKKPWMFPHVVSLFLTHEL